MSVCALAAASCTKEASFTEETKPEAKTEMGAGEVRDGWIRIKIKEDAAPLRAGVFTRGAMESGNEDMDRIAAELGATEVRRVFSAAAGTACICGTTCVSMKVYPCRVLQTGLRPSTEWSISNPSMSSRVRMPMRSMCPTMSSILLR